MRFVRHCLVGVAAAVLCATTARADLVLHAPLDANYNATVGPNGTAVGTPTIVPGKIGAGAVQTRGNPNTDSVVFGEVPGFVGTGPRTISGWVNAATNTQPDWGSAFGFVDNGDATPDDAHSGKFFDVSVEGQPNTRYRPHQWGSEQILQINGQDTLDAGNWHHIVMTYDPATMIIRGYMDGTQGSTFTRPAPGLNTTNNFTIGSRQDDRPATDGHFAGRVDDVAVWNRILDAAQIRALSFVGNTGAVGHDASEAERLFDLFDAGSGSVTLDNIVWRYDADLSRFGGQPGTSFAANDGSYVLSLGTGAAGLVGTVVPEPAALSLLACAGLLLARRRR